MSPAGDAFHILIAVTNFKGTWNEFFAHVQAGKHLYGDQVLTLLELVHLIKKRPHTVQIGEEDTPFWGYIGTPFS